MVQAPLISATALAALLQEQDERPTLLDVRWELASGARREEYLAGHIPGAVFVDLDAQLSAAPGAGGRHPLPSPDAFTAVMRAAGVRNERPVVVYDGVAAMAAARAWWLLRYFSHPAVSVLDGGLEAWIDAGQEQEPGERAPVSGDFTARPGAMPLLDAEGAAAVAARGVLIDARAPERFSGKQEPIDPVAGHIPGAVNRPATANLDSEGRFIERHELRDAFTALGADNGVELGAYCGSGVTAAHEILALELAGFRAALYAGSWSEWITDPTRAVVKDAG